MTTETDSTTSAGTATTEAAASTSTTTNEREITLDDVYRDAKIDTSATATTTEQKTEPAKTEAPKIEPSSIPDAYDTENFKAWLARNAAGTQELHGAVVKIAQHLNHEQKQRLLATTKADIDSAVKAIEETVQIGKPRVIESFLDAEVRADPRMKALWDNRAKNPSAWQSALSIVAKKMAKEFDLKVDPSLTTAQRALKEGRKTMATTAPEETTPQLEADLAKAQGGDFDRLWQATLGGN